MTGRRGLPLSSQPELHPSAPPFSPPSQAYLAGRWPEARAALERLATARRGSDGAAVDDGPARVLLGFMGQSGFVAPPSWAGFRELTEK